MAAIEEQLVDGAYVIALNRPDKLNALTTAMYEGLRTAVLNAIGTAEAEVIVLRAEGRGFCTGGDLGQFLAMTEVAPAGLYAEYVKAYQHHYPFELMMTSPKPVICAVNGIATGGGLALVLASDLVIAGESASFGATEGRIGMFENYVTTLLKYKVGRGRSLYMTLTNRFLSAVEAERWGLAHEVVADAALESRVRELVGEIRRVPPGARAVYKSMLLDALPLLHDARPTVAALLAEEAREGIAAFVAGRPPAWLQERG